MSSTRAAHPSAQYRDWARRYSHANDAPPAPEPEPEPEPAPAPAPTAPPPRRSLRRSAHVPGSLKEPSRASKLRRDD